MVSVLNISAKQGSSVAAIRDVPAGTAESATAHAGADAKSLELPPVLILGGEANALSVARDLGRLGVNIVMLGESGTPVRHSRYCNWIELGSSTTGGSFEKIWSDFLLSPDS